MTEDIFDLSGKTVFITGASSGIGRSTTIICSERNARIILGGRDEVRLSETVSLLNDYNEHICIPGDLSDENAIDTIISELPKLDGIVFNAGMTKTLPVSFVSKDSIDEIFKVNFISSVLLIKGLIRKKKLNEHASICFVSSVASIHPTIANSVYAASKGAINSFTRALALEMAPKSIRVNAVLPGLVETGILKGTPVSDEDLKKHLSNYPLGRFGKPDDIANLILYLLSDASSWMTGSLLTIDGGFSLK